MRTFFKVVLIYLHYITMSPIFLFECECVILNSRTECMVAAGYYMLLHPCSQIWKLAYFSFRWKCDKYFSNCAHMSAGYITCTLHLCVKNWKTMHFCSWMRMWQILFQLCTYKCRVHHLYPAFMCEELKNDVPFMKNIT